MQEKFLLKIASQTKVSSAARGCVCLLLISSAGGSWKFPVEFKRFMCIKTLSNDGKMDALEGKAPLGNLGLRSQY